MKHLIVDGMNFLHRSRAGMQVGPHPLMLNFFRSLRAQVELHKPNRIYFVLEGRPEHRYDIMPEYKENRVIQHDDPQFTEKVSELAQFHGRALDVIMLMERAFPIHVSKHPHFECDDTIANIARKLVNPEEPGVTVKMGKELKEALISNDCKAHVDEFGDFEGIVQGFVDYGTSTGPEVDVCWKPDMLRYGYKPEQLEVVDEVVIVSSDTDFIQLLGESKNIKLYNAMKKSFVTYPEYDYVMWKALRGDATDNIPGVPGVGDKTAQKLATAVRNDPTLHELMLYFLKHPGASEIFQRNLSLIEFHDFSDEDWEGVVTNSGTPDWDHVKAVFEGYGFNSITNDKSWKKFVGTFEKCK